MPELPEVETVCRGLQNSIIGKTIIGAENLRPNLRIEFPENFSSHLENKTVNSVQRKAKYILINLNDSSTIIIHLGMSGKLLVYNEPREDIKKHDHAIFQFQDNSEMVYNDPRRFGLITFSDSENIDNHRLFKNLGIEPLIEQFDGKYLRKILKSKTSSVKNNIMDANSIVGVGNIYACEALFRSKIMPDKQANKICLKDCEELASNIKKVLIEAINSGGSTLRDYVNSTGDSGYFQHKFYVYGRENEDCRLCGTKISRIKQSGRSTFYCPDCQS